MQVETAIKNDAFWDHHPVFRLYKAVSAIKTITPNTKFNVQSISAKHCQSTNMFRVYTMYVQ